MPHAAATHYLNGMTPVKTLRKNDFSKAQLTVAMNLASRRRPGAFVSARLVKLVGGDSAAEAEVSRSKSQLRRTNLLGRTSPREWHVAVLASRRLLQEPGLDGGLAAVAKARDDRAGKLGREPAHFLAINHDHK